MADFNKLELLRQLVPRLSLLSDKKKRLFSILTKTCQTWKQYFVGEVFKDI